MKKQKKLYVLDTSVLGHDFRSIFKFESNDIALPFSVIQELDSLKRRDGNVSYNARNALKFLDESYDNNLEKNPLGENLGDVFVLYLSGDDDYRMKYEKNHKTTNMDDEIIMYTRYAKERYPEYDEVILVSQDAGMRYKASVLKVKTSVYAHDSVQIVNLHKGIYPLEVSEKFINKLYKEKKYITVEDVPFLNDSEQEYNYNSCFILSSESDAKKSALACYQKDKRDEIIDDTLVCIYKRKKSEKIKITTINAEQTLAYHLLMNPDISIVTINGIAGTGKTLLALLSAIDQAVTGSVYKRIIAMRPLVSLSNKDIGFLPGNEQEKIAPFMRPLFDNLDFIKARSSDGIKQKIEQRLEDGSITIEAMAHIRGRTYNDTIVIIDEAQNLTPMEAKTIITRMGKNSKIILVGDVLQIDSPYLNESSNGLTHVIDRFTKNNCHFYGHMNLVKGERSELSSYAAKIL